MTPYSGIEPGHIDPGGIEPGGVPSGRVPAGDDPQARPTGADALVGQLAREGVDTVFGIPGLQIYGIVDALGRSASPMRFVVTRHEQSAAYMADGFARVGGGIGVFTVVPGPGVLNTFAALATASAAGSPVLAIVGQVPTEAQGRGMGVLHDVPEQSELLDRLTSWRRTVRTTGEIPLLVHTAIQQLRAAPQRPVALEIAPDLMLAPFDGVYIDPEPAPRPRTAPDAAVEAVCAMLAEATSPVLYVGGGMRSPEGSAAIRAAAERLAVPIVMSQNGLGTLDAVHPLAADPLDGRALLAQADLVIGVGTRFVLSGQQLALPEECRLVLVNADADHLREPRRPDLPILSDGVAFVDALVAAWRARSRGPRGDGERRVRAAKDVSRAALADIAPQREWLDAIHAGTPDDVILVKDFTQIAYVTPIAWPHRDWACHVAPGYQGNLGYAYAAALGAAVGRPDRPVVAIVGDGGFGWTLPELATAHQYGIPAVVVVFDDGAYGNVARDLETLFEGRVFGAELVNPDFVRVAEAFHVQAARATTPEELSAALRTAIAAREPALIHVPVGRFPDPWHLLL